MCKDAYDDQTNTWEHSIKISQIYKPIQCQKSRCCIPVEYAGLEFLESWEGLIEMSVVIILGTKYNNKILQFREKKERAVSFTGLHDVNPC